MGKKEGKPRGKMSAYAYFVQTCRDELKKKNPNETVVFAEFSKKCGEKWKVLCFCEINFMCFILFFLALITVEQFSNIEILILLLQNFFDDLYTRYEISGL